MGWNRFTVHKRHEPFDKGCAERDFGCAEDAMEGMGEYRWGKLIVSKGQSIVIESKLEEAGIQVCVNRNAVDFYDQTIEGTQSIEVKVDPGTYDIGTYPKDGATGTVTSSVR